MRKQVSGGGYAWRKRKSRGHTSGVGKKGEGKKELISLNMEGKNGTAII